MESITWVGLDVHKDWIAVAMMGGGRGDFVEWRVPNERGEVRRLARKLMRASGGGEIRCCYEGGPCGFVVGRQMEEAGAGLVCEMVAPSKVPACSGDRVKTDRRDARKLCELNRAGLLTVVHRPSEEQEAVRDLCRAREDDQEDLTRARHRLSKWLLRRGLVYGGKSWTKRHREWLRALSFEHETDRAVFANYELAVRQGEQRVQSLDAELEGVAGQEAYRGPVARLRCFRGVDTVTAMTVAAELYDVRRFASPRLLMSYLGMTPSEHSSGRTRRQGGITKTGNGHVRRVLVEAAWHYRHLPAVGLGLRKRREGQPGEIIALADKAQHRLNRRYRRLTERGKPRNKAVVAVARELVGFLWAALVADVRE